MKYLKYGLIIMINIIYLPVTYGAGIVNSNSILKSVKHESRPHEDVKKDSYRHPTEVLKYFDVKKGMVVLDVLAGAGYYSELLSRIVGKDGKVIIQNDAHFLKYYGDTLTSRLKDGSRLKNTKRIDVSLNNLMLEENSLDLIFVGLGYHDFYFESEETDKIDVEKVLAKFKKYLKPTGIIAIIDHQAIIGSPRSVGGTLHRIDPQAVISDMTEAGFELLGRSNMLMDDSDNMSKIIWDVPVGKTSRFILKFGKH